MELTFDAFQEQFHPSKLGTPGLLGGALIERGQEFVLGLAVAAEEHRAYSVTFNSKGVIISSGLNWSANGFLITEVPFTEEIIVTV